MFQVLEVIVMSRYRLTALDTVRNQNFTPFTAMKQKYFYISTSTYISTWLFRVRSAMFPN